MDENFIDSLVKIYLINGRDFVGIVRTWNEEDGIELVAANGDLTKIPCISQVCAVTVKLNDQGKMIKVQRKTQAEGEQDIPKHIPGNASSMLEMQRLKAGEDRQRIVESIDPVKEELDPNDYYEHYDEQLSIIESIKNRNGI